MNKQWKIKCSDDDFLVGAEVRLYGTTADSTHCESRRLIRNVLLILHKSYVRTFEIALDLLSDREEIDRVR